MSLLSNLFKTKKTPSYGGIQPYGTLMDAAGGKDYYNTILGRSQGKDVGFGDTYASKYANPIIQNSRATFQDRTMPELNSELSLTGRRRGSSGFQQVAQAQKEQGLQENDIFSRLQQRNEDQMRNEQNRGIEQLGEFNKGDFNARNTLAGFQNDLYKGETANIQNDRATNDAAGMRIGQAGVALGMVPFTGGASIGVPQASAMDDYIRSITKRAPEQPKQINTVGKQFGNYGQAGRVR